MAGPALASLAWRNLWRNRRRTLLTLASIAFGTFLTMLMTSTQDRNFSDFIDLAARLGGGHVSLQHPEYHDTPTLTRSVKGTAALRELALADPGVRRAVERIQGQAMIGTAADSAGGFFLAYDPTREDESTFSFANGIVAGEALSTPDGKDIVLGRKLAEILGAELGDKVVYTVVDIEGEIASGVARVSGLVATGAPSADAGLFLLPIDRAREVMGYAPDEATQVALFVDESRHSPRVRDRLRSSLPSGVVALTWDEAQPDLAAFIAMKVGGARFMELVILILAAASIFNTLFVSVMERTREFGIMLAIGYSPGQLFRLVMAESTWLGLVGIGAGGAITAPLYMWLVANPVDLSSMTAGQEMDIAGVGMPPVLNFGIFPENAVIICVIVLVTTLVAGIYPAWRAGRVQPVEAIQLV